jgi:4-amino-4-deoxy-L-arabinose transferase-like glycosyltransferase
VTADLPAAAPRPGIARRLVAGVWPADRARRALSLLLLVFVLKGLLFVVIFPPFSGHDEVAHYAYIRLLATEQRLPVIPELEAWRETFRPGQMSETGDFLPKDLYPYCRYVLDWWCAADDPRWLANPPYGVTFLDDFYPAGWQYAANHPPLYYALASPAYLLTDGLGPAMQMRLLRMLAIPFGMLVVVATFAIGRALFPRDSFVALVAAMFIAFQPQLAYEAAMVNNDIVAVAAVAALLALLVRGVRQGFTWRRSVVLGVVFGLALLSKGTPIVFAPVIALGMIGGIGWRRVTVWAPRGALVGGLGFAMAAPWYLHLHRLYGDFSGLDRVASLQYMWTYTDDPAKPAPGFFDLLWNRDFAAKRWAETWGEYGWRLIHLDAPLLIVIGVLCLMGLLGFLLLVGRALVGRDADDERLDARQWWGLATLLVASVLGYLAVVQFGMRFELTQARYFFPALPAAAIVLAAGWRAILPASARPWGQAVAALALLALNVFLLTAYVLPYWSAGEPR